MITINENEQQGDISQEYQETKMTGRKKPKSNTPRKVSGASRSLHISIPHTTDQLSLAVLSIICGTNASQLIRDLLEPYFEFIKDEFLFQDGIVNEYGALVVTPEMAVEYYASKVANDPRGFLDKISQAQKEKGLDFKTFLHPENLYK